MWFRNEYKSLRNASDSIRNFAFFRHFNFLRVDEAISLHMFTLLGMTFLAKAAGTAESLCISSISYWQKLAL